MACVPTGNRLSGIPPGELEGQGTHQLCLWGPSLKFQTSLVEQEFSNTPPSGSLEWPGT